MSEAWERRLQLRADKLKEHVDRTSALVYKAQLSEEGVTCEELKTCIARLKSAVDAYEKEFITFTDKTNPTDTKAEECMRFQMEAEDIYSELGNLLSKAESATADKTDSFTRLPKLDLPSYQGDILKFHEFWDRFLGSVHERNLPDVDKLSYLKSCLAGEALKSIEGLCTNNANYQIAIDTLKKRFGQQDVLVDAHYNALNTLPRAGDNARECRNTLASVEVHLRVLQSLGQDVNNNHLRVTVLGKFPERVLYQVSLLTSADQSVHNLRKALETVINAMERAIVTIASDEAAPMPAASSAAALSCKAVASTSNNYNKNNNRKRKFFNNKEKNKNYTPNKEKPKDEGYNKDTKEPPKKRSKLCCIFCSSEHYNDLCDAVPTIKERLGKLNNRCHLCFSLRHVKKDCRSKKKCFYCRALHNRALCPEKFDAAGIILKESIQNTSVTVPQVNNKTYLQTVTVQLQNNNNNLKCRALLDCGSQRSYLTTRTATKLNMDMTGEDLLRVYTFGANKPKEISSQYANIDIITKRGVKRTIRVNVVPHITDRIPSAPTAIVKAPIDILADDESPGGEIELLIGNDYYFSFIREDRIKMGENLFLINTDFGWIPSGTTTDFQKGKGYPFSLATFCQCQEPILPYLTLPDPPLREVDVKYLWALENIGITDSPKTTREEEAVTHFNNTVQYQDQRYQVTWPWIDYPPDLPTNFGLAYGRLKGLVSRLDSKSLEDYNSIIQEQLDAGIIEIVESEVVPKDQVSPPIHYLPHHIVQQEGKRGRIVYDGSAKLKEQKGLNECLYKGPSMLEDLLCLILKFRTKRVGLIADVEKAFLQIGLQPDDRDVTRFLWVKDPSKDVSNENLLHLRFRRLPFGVVSSPFLLTATIRYHLQNKDDEMIKKLADSIYVDNLVTGAQSTTEAVELYHKTRSVFQELSMNIREWMSNDLNFLQSIPKETHAHEGNHVKLLGLLWNPRKDTFELKLDGEIFNEDSALKTITTKREVLKTIASFYDPCGFASPLLLPAKLLLQELWKRKIKWEAEIPDDLKESWEFSLNQITAAKEIEVPRYVNVSETERVHYDLHCFSDASKNAYAAVVYLCVQNEEQNKVELILSKSKVTPLKDKDDLKIPRLELLGFLVGSRILKYVENSMGLPIRKRYLWTDSLIVLSWMKSAKLLPPFVSKRVAEIKQNANTEWRYVNTEQNPADLATRSELWQAKKDLWFGGPLFLKEGEIYWPNLPNLGQEAPSVTAEALVQEALCVAAERLDIDDPEYEPEVRELIETDRTTDKVPEESKLTKIQNLQKQFFPLETAGKTTHLSRNLGLFLDVDGLLRCTGRMTHTDWSFDKKHPILIPKESDFTRALILETHKKNHHVGVPHTLSILRQQYWIPQGRNQVQKVLKTCAQCSRHGGGPYKLPPTPALPAERVNYSTPFTYTGVDYFGPIFVNSGQEKRWVCLFTCLAVRAIHMELVKDLSGDEFVLALRRFTSSRGVPKMMVSDNALHFKLTAQVISSTLSQAEKIEWKFIPEMAPWHGSFYERLIGVVKRCLRRSLEKHLVTESQMLTILKEVEAVINTRPLTYVGQELDHILTPADFLSLGKCLAVPPLEDHGQEGTVTGKNLVEGWKRGQRLLEEFKRMFTDQYLPSLRERYQHSLREPRIKTTREPKLGDIVQIKGDSKNRENWRVGKIVNLFEGADGECRVALVKVGTKEFRRSIHHLYPLEIQEESWLNMDSYQTSSRTDERAKQPLIIQPLQLNNSHLGEQMKNNPDIEAVGELHYSATAEPDQVMEDNSLSGVHPSLEQEASDTSDATEPPATEGAAEAADVGSNEENITMGRLPRKAALRAREKIAELSRQLMSILCPIPPLGECRETYAIPF